MLQLQQLLPLPAASRQLPSLHRCSAGEAQRTGAWRGDLDRRGEARRVVARRPNGAPRGRRGKAPVGAVAPIPRRGWPAGLAAHLWRSGNKAGAPRGPARAHTTLPIVAACPDAPATAVSATQRAASPSCQSHLGGPAAPASRSATSGPHSGPRGLQSLTRHGAAGCQGHPPTAADKGPSHNGTGAAKRAWPPAARPRGAIQESAAHLARHAPAHNAPKCRRVRRPPPPSLKIHRHRRSAPPRTMQPPSRENPPRSATPQPHA